MGPIAVGSLAIHFGPSPFLTANEDLSFLTHPDKNFRAPAMQNWAESKGTGSREQQDGSGLILTECGPEK